MVNPNDLAFWQHVVINLFMFVYGSYLILSVRYRTQSYKYYTYQIKLAKKMLKQCIELEDDYHAKCERNIILCARKNMLKRAVVIISGILGMTFPIYYTALLLLL